VQVPSSVTNFDNIELKQHKQNIQRAALQEQIQE